MKLNLNKLLQPVCSIAVQAGLIINKYYKYDNEISFKKDHSPLTKADLASNKFIINSLSELELDIPILSEESFVNWNVRKNWYRYWLVDPLDGTKEFIKKNDEFTVNIALIDNHCPVLGVIYAPALAILYFSYKNGGAYKLNIEATNKIKNYFDNSIKLQTSIKTKNDFLKIICSRSHPNDDFNQWIEKNVSKFEIIHKGSSLKFCDIAEGIANLYPRFRPKSEWDIAAGHIILNEAGGIIKSFDQKEIVYNCKESVINPYFIASCKLDL